MSSVDLSGYSTAQLQAMAAQAGDAPASVAPDPVSAPGGMGAANPPPQLPGLPAGAYRHPKYANVVMNADGRSIYGLGDFAPQDSNTNEIDIGGTTDPASISDFVARHPDVLPPADAPVPGGGAQSPPSPQGAGLGSSDGSASPDLSGMSTADLQSMLARQNGDPDPNTPQGYALQQARKQSAGIPGWLRSAMGGQLMNLEDEVAGAGSYAGTAVNNLLTGMKGGTPTLSPSDAYAATTRAEREAQDAFAKAHPVANLAATAGGALLNPLNYMGGEFIGGAESLGGAALRSGVVGAGTGAAYGAGDGTDIASRFSSAINGAGWGAATGFALPFVGAGVGAITKPFRSTPAATAGAMSSAADALGKFGVTLADLPTSALAKVQAAAAQGLHPGDAAVQEMARSLPVPVPLTRGQITGDPIQQLQENLALRGGQGHPAQLLAQGFRQQQQQALRAGVDQIGADLGGGLPAARGEAGGSISDALNNLRDQQWQGVNQAYADARSPPTPAYDPEVDGPEPPSAPQPAYLQPADAHRFVQAAQQGMADFDPLNVPRVAREVDRLQDQAAPWARDLPPGVNPARISQVSGAQPADVRTLFESRARLSKLRASNDPVESAAATSVLHHFDGAMGDALSNDLFSGDPTTVGLWRKAIGARADFGRMFQANDLVEKLTARDGVGGSAQLKVDPSDASNYILGRSNLGFVGRQNLTRGLNRLKGALGEDSDGWQRLRSEAFGRIAAAGNGAMEGGTQEFSGAKFASAWQRAKREDPQVVSTLFSERDRGVIDRFATVAAMATKPVTGGDNSSNTAVAAKALGAMRKIGLGFIESLPGVGHMADKIDDVTHRRAIMAATLQAAPRRVDPLISAKFAKALGGPGTAYVTTAHRRRADQ